MVVQKVNILFKFSLECVFSHTKCFVRCLSVISGCGVFPIDLLKMAARSCFRPPGPHTKAYRWETVAEAQWFRAADVASKFTVSASCE